LLVIITPSLTFPAVSIKLISFMQHQTCLNKYRIYLFYWTTFISVSANVPFFSLYLKHILVSPDGRPILELLGLILFIQPVLCIFANPFAGYIADKFKIENRILLVCCSFVCLGGLFLGFPLIARHLELGVISTICNELPTTVLFIGLGTVFIGLFSGPISPIINTETYEHLHNFPSSVKSYGHFRVHGTLAWVVSTVLFGFILQLTQNLSLIIIFYCTGYGLCGLLALTGLKTHVKPVKIPWIHLKKDRNFQLFLIFCFLQAFGLFSTNNFLGYFFDELHLDYKLMGIAFSISAIPEIPLMFLAKRLSQRLGNRLMVLIGTSILIVRLLSLAAIAAFGQPWLCLLVMPLSGLGFGFLVNGVMNLIDKWAHKDLRAMYMNLYTMIGVNLPVALGGLFNALVIKQLNSTWMLLFNATIVLFGILFFLFFIKEESMSSGHTGTDLSGTQRTVADPQRTMNKLT
jgi:PPP family 3-phenylpropionic acid transporter